MGGVCGRSPPESFRDEFADEIAAFANAQGGVLLCGVSDEAEVQAMSRAQMVALDKLLVEVSSDAIKPPVSYSRSVIGTCRAAGDCCW